MNHHEFETKLPLFLEGLLAEEDLSAFKAHEQQCEDCAKKLQEWQTLEDTLQSLKLKEPEPVVWERFEDGVFNRLERGFGWLLFVLGMAVLAGYGVTAMFAGFFQNPAVPFWIKAGLLCLHSGMFILLLSVIREQLQARKKERYKEIDR